MLAVLLISFVAKVTLFWTSAEKDFNYLITSSYGMSGPERCNSFMIPFLPVKQCTTCDKGTALANFFPVTRLCQFQTTDLR